jgi:hypothetical protein
MTLAAAINFAPWIIGIVALLMFPLGRRILKWWVLLSIGFVLLLAGSEPDLRD